MYLKIEDLTPSEYKKLKELFSDRLESIGVYEEVCKVEADCALERVLDELNLTLSTEDYNKAVDTIAEELANYCEDNAFQDMCEKADEITEKYIKRS